MLRVGTREEFKAVQAAIPEHDRRVEEIRSEKNNLFYIQCLVRDQDGRLAALHDTNGTYWVSDLFLGK